MLAVNPKLCKPNHTLPRSTRPGFSMVELVVALFITLMVILAAYSIFQLTLRTKPLLQNRAEIVQNMRSVFDRFSRELRQANVIVTTLPASEILFEDGHGNLDNVPLQYIRYHLTGTDLYREVRYYSFAGSPSTHVSYDDVDANGNPPTATVTEDRLIGQYVTSLNFSASNGNITIATTLTLSSETLTLTTNVVPRNTN